MAELRGHNERSVNERTTKSGKIRYQAQISVPGGGRRSQTFGTERAALAWVRKCQAEIATGTLAAKRPPTFKAYLRDTWLPMMANKVKPSTLDCYRLNVDRVPDLLGALRMDELRPRHFQDFYNELSGGHLSPSTVVQCHRVLHRALKDAMVLDVINRNPTDAVRLPRVPQYEAHWYTAEQLAQMNAGTEGDRFHALWLVLGSQGLRLGEALALRWDDIDWKRGTLTVRHKLERDRIGGAGLVLGETKTKGSRRTVTLTPDTKDALQAHQDRQRIKSANTAAWEDRGFIFCTDIGTPLDVQRIHAHWRKACEKVGIPRHRIHDMRHSWASILLMGGMPAERLAKAGGWSTVNLIFSTYGHIIPGDYGDGADIMQSALQAARAGR